MKKVKTPFTLKAKGISLRSNIQLVNWVTALINARSERPENALALTKIWSFELMSLIYNYANLFIFATPNLPHGSGIDT